jgi:hypothetical protein
VTQTERKKAFDFGAAMRRLAEDIVGKCPEMAHIRLEAVEFTFTRSRVEGEYGQFAKIIPMKFENGAEITVRKRRKYRIPPLMIEGRTILYAISFCQPKFQNLSFEDKLLTVFHEMYHISPKFDGDIRRFPGKNYAHGPSRDWYNAVVKRIVDAYVDADPDIDAMAFLRWTADEIFERYEGFTAKRIPMPKLIPVEPPKKTPRAAKR